MRRFLLACVACSLIFTFCVFFQGTAHAASTHQAIPNVSCSGNGCNNTDPYATGCANSKKDVFYGESTDANGLANGTIWLEYSKVCQTNWTEVDAWLPQGATTYIYGRINRASGPDGGTLSYSFSSSRYSWINTNQVYSLHNQSQPCGAVANGPVVCLGYV